MRIKIATLSLLSLSVFLVLQVDRVEAQFSTPSSTDADSVNVESADQASTADEATDQSVDIPDGTVFSDGTVFGKSKTRVFQFIVPTAPSTKPSVVKPQAGVGVCNLMVQQDQSATIAPPLTGYDASIECAGARPTYISVRILTSNINNLDPENVAGTGYTFIRSEPRYNCTANPCQTPTYTYTITATQYFRVEAQALVTASDGSATFVTVPIIGAYNRRGELYPRAVNSKFQSLGFPDGHVPFPSRFPNRPAYTICETTGGPAPCARTIQQKFRTNTITQYNNNRWAIPADPFQAHHIRPLKYGGGETVDLTNTPPANPGGATDNTVLLPTAIHQVFSNWWTGFTP
jgi:hypothetical protein